MTKNNPSFVSHGDSSPTTSVRPEIDAFLAEMKGASTAEFGIRGRLIFALDATASRQPTWDTACELQADMFREAAVSVASRAGELFERSKNGPKAPTRRLY